MCMMCGMLPKVRLLDIVIVGCDSHTVTTIGVRKKLLKASKEKDCEVMGK